MSETLLCFGGPRNEQMLTIDRSPVLVAFPHRVALDVTDDGPLAPTFPTGRYNVRELGFHNERACRTRPIHGDHCRWLGRCLVYEGFPEHRIVDALNAVAILARWTDWIASRRGS